MKHHDRSLALGAMAVVLTWLLAPAGLQAQEPGMGMHDPERMAQHQQMMERHEQMVARMDSLATAMNESTGEARVDAMGVLLNEIVEQHRAMHEHMREFMMHRMMGEGHPGMMGPPPEAMPKPENQGHKHPPEPES